MTNPANFSPQSGRYTDKNGNIRNFVDDLLAAGSVAEPVDKSLLNVTQFPALSGLFTAEDGQLYELKALLEGLGGDSYSKAEVDSKIEDASNGFGVEDEALCIRKGKQEQF